MKPTLVAAAAGALIIAAPATALAADHAAAPTTANFQISLAPSGAYALTGGAQYQSQPGQRELQVELEHLAALRGSSLVVRVNGVVVGSMKVAGNGIAQLTKNTEAGQPVPAIAHGSTVTVKTAGGGAVTSGRF
jgi:hypothetical protein